MESNTQHGRKRNVIIAIPNPSFGDGLKKHFENEGVNVIGVYVVLDHLIEKLHSLKSEPNIKLDGLVLNSSIAAKGKDKRLEFLADVIEKIRDDFSETSIIFLSDEMQGHPLLAELVSMGVYNIFAKSAQKTEPLNIKQLIRCIDQPMLYSEVRKFRDYNKDIPWRRFINGAQTITINVENPKDNTPENSPARNTSTQEPPREISVPSTREEPVTIKTETTTTTPPATEPPKQKDALPNILEEELEEEEFLWTLPPVRPKVIVRDRIIGKQIIAVAGIEKGVGTTHTAILVANHLASKGYQVKLIECNGSNEFVYIEKAYEGRNVDVNRSDEFEINGVTYVKSSENLDMTVQMTSEHTHIVLDLGSYENSEYIEEFHRAGIQLLVGSGSEWKQYTIKQFIKSNRDVDQSRWKFVVPFANKQTINDIKGDNEDISVVAIPYHPDPFIGQDKTEECLDVLFEGGRPKRRKLLKIGFFTIGLLIVAGIAMYFIFK
jgi:hypothetical protein